MKKLEPGLSVIYAGGDLKAAFGAVQQARSAIVIDDIMAARISVKRDYPATIVRVVDEVTADLELQDVPEGQPRQRFAVKHGVGPDTFRFLEEQT